MPKNLTPSASSFVTPRGNLTGDKFNEADMNDCFQSHADRAEYLHAQLNANGGKAPLIELADITALKAIDTTTGVADGELRYVHDNGIYIWRSAATTTETTVGKWVVQPTTGGGRWFNLAHFQPQKLIQRGRYYNAAIAFLSGANPAFVQVGTTITLSDVRIGDVIRAYADMETLQDGGFPANPETITLNVHDGANNRKSRIVGLGALVVPVSLAFEFTATSAITHTVKLEVSAAGGMKVKLQNELEILVEHFRP